MFLDQFLDQSCTSCLNFKKNSSFHLKIVHFSSQLSALSLSFMIDVDITMLYAMHQAIYNFAATFVRAQRRLKTWILVYTHHVNAAHDCSQKRHRIWPVHKLTSVILCAHLAKFLFKILSYWCDYGDIVIYSHCPIAWSIFGVGSYWRHPANSLLDFDDPVLLLIYDHTRLPIDITVSTTWALR